MGKMTWGDLLSYRERAKAAEAEVARLRAYNKEARAEIVRLMRLLREASDDAA